MRNSLDYLEYIRQKQWVRDPDLMIQGHALEAEILKFQPKLRDDLYYVAKKLPIQCLSTPYSGDIP